jgi:spore maturation protein SpmA
MQIIARAIRPLMVRLFPDVPADHPAMSAMIMNMAANALGLGNAATPMGIKAMTELDKLNAQKGTATNAMCLFLAINTSSVTLLPLGVISIRAAAGATDPASILLPSLFATICSTTVAIVASKLLARRGEQLLTPQEITQSDSSPEVQTKPSALTKPSPGVYALIVPLLAAFAAIVVLKFVKGGYPPILSTAFVTTVSGWLVPILMSFFLLYGFFKGVKVYEAVTEGAKEGFNVAMRIIPYMVAIFVAIGMFRASGTMDLLAMLLDPVLSRIGMPTEALPMALMRPLSGSGAFAIMSEIVSRSPDSYVSALVSTIQGSTETTFYVLAVYFGAVSIRQTRHALPAALLADAAGIMAAVIACRIFF